MGLDTNDKILAHKITNQIQMSDCHKYGSFERVDRLKKMKTPLVFQIPCRILMNAEYLLIFFHFSINFDFQNKQLAIK